MIRIKGHLQIPKAMESIIEERQKKEKNETIGYLGSFERLIDPVLIGALFGLYKSQALPPIEKDEIRLAASHEFNADITHFTENFNHFLFCLWVKKNGAPDETVDINNYREELYEFISRLLDSEYYKNVLIPFYLDKADQQESGETSSFLHRLSSSNKVGPVLELYSPEYLAREFSDAQNDFITNVIMPLAKQK